MPKFEIELDDKGDFVGTLPAEIDSVIKRVELESHKKGYGQGAQVTAAEAKKQIEEAVKAEAARINAMAPIEKERHEQISRDNEALTSQLNDLRRTSDQTAKSREESHARELVSRAEREQKLAARIRESMGYQLRMEALAHGAREDSLQELAIILSNSIGYDDEMKPFVKGEDGAPLLVHGKPVAIDSYVKQYLDGHPHHRKPAGGQGGGARGGAFRPGQATGGSDFEAARKRFEDGEQNADTINDMFLGLRKKRSA